MEPDPHRNALKEARQMLEGLQGSDAATGQWSVDHCSMMLKFWSAEFLDADRQIATARELGKSSNTREVLDGMSRRKTASDQAGEWEKRKAGAMMSIRVDLLRDVLKRLDEQDALSDQLLEIEE